MTYFPDDDYQNRAYHPKYDKEPSEERLGYRSFDPDDVDSTLEPEKVQETEQSVAAEPAAKACNHSSKSLLGSMDGVNYFHCKNCDQYLQESSDDDAESPTEECKHRSVGTVFNDGSRKIGTCLDCDQEFDVEEHKRKDPLWRKR